MVTVGSVQDSRENAVDELRDREAGGERATAHRRSDRADRLSRRSTLVRAGGLAAAALGAASLPAEAAGAAGQAGALACVLSPEMTEGPYYLREREAAPQHHRGPARARR